MPILIHVDWRNGDANTIGRWNWKCYCQNKRNTYSSTLGESVQCWQEEWEILRVLNYGKLQTQAGNPYSTSQVVNIRLMIQGIYILRISAQFIYCTCIILQLNDMRFRAELTTALNSLTSRRPASYSSKKPFLALRLAGDSHLHGTMILFSFSFWREHFHPKSQSHQRVMYLPFCCITMAGS